MGLFDDYEEVEGGDLSKFLKKLKKKIASGEIDPEDITMGVGKIDEDGKKSKIKEMPLGKMLGSGDIGEKLKALMEDKSIDETGELIKTLKIPKSLKKYTDKYSEAKDKLETFRENTQILEEEENIASAEMWDAIGEMFPECNTKKSTINPMNMTINVYKANINF